MSTQVTVWPTERKHHQYGVPLINRNPTVCTLLVEADSQLDALHQALDYCNTRATALTPMPSGIEVTITYERLAKMRSI